MNKSELVARLARRAGLKQRQARAAVDALFDPDPRIGLIAGELAAGRRVCISGFGAFESRRYNRAITHNPFDGQKIEVPARNYAAFRPGLPLKALLRQVPDGAAA